MKSPGMSSHRAAPFFVEGRESWASEYGTLLHNLPNIALRFDFLSSYVPALSAPGSRLRVLDLGAAYGYYASVLQLHGHEIFAMEWAEDAAAAAALRLGKDRVFHQSVAEPFPLPADSVDLIYAFDLVEHIDNETVERMLVSCERVLGPNGVLVISTPDNGIRARVVFKTLGLAVPRLPELLFGPDHVNLFDAARLRKMLERTMTHSRIVDIVSTNFMFGRYPIASVVDRFVLRAFRASANLVAIVRKER